MTILAPAPGFDDWDDQDLTDAIDWAELEPTAAELAAIEADADEDAAQERIFAELVSRLTPYAVKRTGRGRSVRRPGRRQPRRCTGTVVRVIRTGAAR